MVKLDDEVVENIQKDYHRAHGARGTIATLMKRYGLSRGRVTTALRTPSKAPEEPQDGLKRCPACGVAWDGILNYLMYDTDAEDWWNRYRCNTCNTRFSMNLEEGCCPDHLVPENCCEDHTEDHDLGGG